MKHETVEEFIRRGGVILHIPRGYGVDNALKPTKQMIIINAKRRAERLQEERERGKRDETQ